MRGRETHGSEASAQGYELRVVFEVKKLHLLQGGLASGETPGLGKNLAQSQTRGGEGKKEKEKEKEKGVKR